MYLVQRNQSVKPISESRGFTLSVTQNGGGVQKFLCLILDLTVEKRVLFYQDYQVRKMPFFMRLLLLQLNTVKMVTMYTKHTRSGKCHFLRGGHLTCKLLFSWLQYVLPILGPELPLLEKTNVTIDTPSFKGYCIYWTYQVQEMRGHLTRKHKFLWLQHVVHILGL